MLLLARVKLTSPILGELKKDHTGTRRLRKRDGRVAMEGTEWQKKFAAASRILGMHLNPASLMFERGFECPSTRLYRRHYSRVEVEMFEAISKGTVLTFRLAVVEGDGAPTRDQVRDLLEAIGEFIGMTQFGEQFGYGRFEVLEVGTQQDLRTNLETCSALKSFGEAGS